MVTGLLCYRRSGLVSARFATGGGEYETGRVILMQDIAKALLSSARLAPRQMAVRRCTLKLPCSHVLAAPT